MKYGFNGIIYLLFSLWDILIWIYSQFVSCHGTHNLLFMKHSKTLTEEKENDGIEIYNADIKNALAR